MKVFKMASMAMILFFSLSMISASVAESHIVSIGDQKNVENALKDCNDVQSINVAASSYSIAQICDASSRVKAFTETNHKLPNYVNIAGNQVTMPQFLRLMVVATQKLNNGNKDPVQFKYVNNPTNPSENMKNGELKQLEYVNLAGNIQKFIDNNGRAPNNVNSSLGEVGYKNMIYTYSKVLSFYKSNNRLPSEVEVNKWTWKLESSSQDIC